MENEVITLHFKDYTKPEIDLKDNYNEPYVKYGSDNLFPNQLIDFATYSPEHSALIQLRQNLISARGFVYKNDTGVKAFFDKINASQTADEILERISNDLSILETFALQIIYDRQPEPKIARVNYIDSSKVRCGIVDEKGVIKGYWVSEDWSDETISPIYHPCFNLEKSKKQKSQIYFFRRPSLGQPYYANVSYIAGLNWIALSKEISKFGLNFVKNGFFWGGILEYPNQPDEAKKKEIKKQIQNTFQGAENAGKIIIAWVTQDGKPVSFTPITPTDNSSMLQTLNSVCIQKIATSHRCNPILAGVDREGASLGGDKNMLITALEAYNSTVIYNLQKPIVNIFNKILLHNGYGDVGLAISDNTLIKNTIPEGMASKVLLIDEVREEAGLKPLLNEEGQKLVEGDVANVFDQQNTQYAA